jgi:hypothetical protein
MDYRKPKDGHNMIGILLRDIGPSELSAEALHHALPYDVVFFVENSVRPMVSVPKTVLNIADAFTFKGPLVATGLSTARKLLNMPAVSGRSFYPWNREWVNTRVHYRELAAYRNAKLKLFARCEDYRLALTNCFNREATVVPNFTQLYEMLKNESVTVKDLYTLDYDKGNTIIHSGA